MGFTVTIMTADINLQFKCDYCEYSAKRKESLTRHIKIHHLKQKILSKMNFLRFDCDECGYFASQKVNLQAHKEGAHMDTKLKCNICNYETKWKRSLDGHAKVHMNSENKRYFECRLLEYKSIYKNGLKVHMETHNSSKKYECNLCKAKLNTKAILKLHLRSIHEGIKYDCNLCDKSFTQKCHLRSHKNSVHATSFQSVSCKTCDYKGRSKRSLQTHIKYKHSHREPVECQECFKKVLDLTAHKKNSQHKLF